MLHTSSEPLKLTIRSLFLPRIQRNATSSNAADSSTHEGLSPAQKPGRPCWTWALAALLTVGTLLGITACAHDYYAFPEYNFAGRPIPPSQLAQRVLVGVSPNSASTGALVILDGQHDLRSNIQNTVAGFAISGYSGFPTLILNFPEQLRGYVYSNTPPYAVTSINYSTEASLGSAGSFNGASTSLAIAPDFIHIFSAVLGNGQLVVVDNSTGGTYALNLPNVYRVAVNTGDTVALAMVKNSNALYRVIKLPANSVNPPGAIDCEPQVLPVYCVVPVPGTFDRPIGATFSLDGSSVYVENCGIECGGGTNGGAGVSILPQGALYINSIPTSVPYPNVVTRTVSIPGGVTDAVLDGTNLYASGQSLQPDGLLAGNLTVVPLATLVPNPPISISDGTHTRMLFADDNTLWIGSQFCATGERAKLGLNYNCLTRYDVGAGTASIIPALTTANPTVPYPNGDNNLVYYGSLTGICWVQNFHKVYTAYGGQVHAFNTVDGSEINNVNITVQGTALDVAYMDALTNQAN